MQDKKREVDQLIKETLNEKFERLPAPPLLINESWEQLQALKKKSERTYKKPRVIIAASILLILVSVIFYSPTNSSAFSRLADIIHKIQGTVTQLFVSAGENSEDKNAIPADGSVIIEESVITSHSMSLDEAQAATAFEIIVPKEMPETYVLKDVTVLKKGDEKNNEIYLNYEGAQGALMIAQRLMDDQYGTSVSIDNEDTAIEKLNINGHLANLLSYKTGARKLIWATQDFYFSIEGKIAKDEIVRIAHSMQK